MFTQELAKREKQLPGPGAYIKKLAFKIKGNYTM
jgi:hypothetical protein